MKKWFENNKNLTNDYFFITYVVSYLIIIASIFMITNRYKDAELIRFPDFLLIALILLTIFCLILYKFRQILIQTEKISIINYIFAFVNILLICILMFLFNSSHLEIKTLFFIPIILASLTYDKIYRFIVCSTCTISLLIIDYYKYYHTSLIKDYFDTDILIIGVFFLVSWLIGNLRQIELDTQQYLEKLAQVDDLTGLSNHRHFQEQLSEEIAQAKKQKNNLALIMLDIDYFKFYNDTYGHQCGDEVLKQMGSILLETIGEKGFSARYGGEEFAVILPGLNAEQASAIAENLRERVAGYEFYGAEMQPQGRLTISCGIAVYPQHAENKQELIRAADEALYKAKYSSKNKVELYFNVFSELNSFINASERELLNSIRTLISIINAKDRYTYGHSERVTVYAGKLAQKLGFTEHQLAMLSYAAYLHDIGKIEISRELLNKRAALTCEEWQIFSKHPVWGADIIKPINPLREIYPFILYHHENYDGTGYPHGLCGSEIPVEARILRIADSFDAMTTERPYKKSMTVEEALAELQKYAGSHFDPLLVTYFLELYAERSLPDQNR